MSKPDAALFVLVSNKSAYNKIFLAPKSALQWCYMVYDDQVLPSNVIDDMKAFLADDYDGDLEIEVANIDPGSADNDAALFLAGVCRSFKSPIEAVRYADAHYNLDPADCYMGLEY